MNQFQGNSWCIKCWQEHNTKKIQERTDQGLCTGCGKSQPVEGKKQCRGCRDKNNSAARQMKINALNHYGDRCQLCGERQIEFLSIDHVDNNGSKHRKELGIKIEGKTFYGWLKKQGYPVGFQVLCHNCNLAKAKRHLPSRIKKQPETGITKRCSRCKTEKDTSSFYWRKERNTYHPHCKECNSKQNKQQGEKRKQLVFSHYGEECECCGETTLDYLTVDHVVITGTEQRKRDPSSVDIYKWLVRNNFPEGYRTLCMNCNVSLGRFGYCPHALSKGEQNE